MTKDPNEKTIPCPLRAAALANPDAPAITSHDGELSYAEFDSRATSTAKKLKMLDLSDGARVGVYAPKSADYFILVLAAVRAGCVLAPMNTRTPPKGLPPLLEAAGCSALVSDSDEALRAAEASGFRPLRTAEALDGGEGETPTGESRIPPERPATIIFTSGSTGKPKAALHTFGNHYFNALGSNENISLSPGDVWLHSLPLYHVGGLSILFRCLLAGATVALPEPDAPMEHAIVSSGATHVSLVATQLRRLLDDDEGADLSRVRAILLGGSAIPEILLDEAHRRGLPVHASYGLTEMSSQATTTRPGAAREELRTSGEALPYREVSISSEGEILVKGETLFVGYVERDGLSRPVDEDGWFHTRDIGRMDERGRLRVVGRKDNLFISGGENIQPEEIEDETRRMKDVEDVVVVPVPDEEFGFRPAAFVKGNFSAERLRTSLEASLPRFKVPVAFHPWPSDAPTGMKVDRGFFMRRASGKG